MTKTRDDDPSEFDEVQEPLVLTDENISQEQINEMKMLGIEKPQSVSYERWNQLQSIRFEHEHIIHLAASMVPQWKIAQLTGYDQAHISKILRTPEVKAKVQKQVEEVYGADHKKAVKDLGMKAISVVSEVLDNPSDKERAGMAKFVIEHSIGKAQQEVKHTGGTLNEFIVKIEQMKSENQLRDVSATAGSLPKAEDPFDNVIRKVIPVGMVVGKRSGGESEGQT